MNRTVVQLIQGIDPAFSCFVCQHEAASLPVNRDSQNLK